MDIYDLKMMYRDKTKEEILAAYNEFDMETVDNVNGDRTLLHTAAAMADKEAVKLLLEKGISANIKDRYGNFPLHTLAALDYVRDCRYGGVTEDEVRECADLLFDAGASTMRKNEDGIPALCDAAKYARYEILESAVSHGVKLTMTDRDGNNPLHVACDWIANPINYDDRGRSIDEEEQKEGYLRCIRVLVDAGIDSDEKNDYGKTPLELAIESGVKEAAVIITGDESMAATGGMTVFQAIENNDMISLKALIENGANLNETADEGCFLGMTPLAAACLTFNMEAVELLLEAGVDVNEKNGEGETCLTRLLKAGDCEGEPFWQKNDNSLCKKLLKLLWSAGMNKNAQINDNSDTALTLALRKGYNDGQMDYHFAVALIDGGCDVNLSDSNGVTPLMLVSRNCDITDLQISIMEAGAGLEAVDRNGNTPLHYAAGNRSDNTAKEMAEMLFEFGFENPEAVNNNGKTALEIAEDNNNEMLVKLILTNL